MMLEQSREWDLRGQRKAGKLCKASPDGQCGNKLPCCGKARTDPLRACLNETSHSQTTIHAVSPDIFISIVRFFLNMGKVMNPVAEPRVLGLIHAPEPQQLISA